MKPAPIDRWWQQFVKHSGLYIPDFFSNLKVAINFFGLTSDFRDKFRIHIRYGKNLNASRKRLWTEPLFNLFKRKFYPLYGIIRGQLPQLLPILLN